MINYKSILRQRLINILLPLCFIFLSHVAYGQKINSLSDPRLPAELIKKLEAFAADSTLGRNFSTRGTLTILDTASNSKDIYEWKIYIGKSNHLSGFIYLVSTDNIRGNNKRTVIINKYDLDIEVLFCCTTNRNLCVTWSERKKHRECKLWKILSAK